MARAAYIAAIWILAISLGILGYQGLTLFFYESWPPVSLGYGWDEVLFCWHAVFGSFMQPHFPDLPDGLGWVARTPLVLAGIVLSYVLFLLSDSLRGRAARLSQ